MVLTQYQFSTFPLVVVQNTSLYCSGPVVEMHILLFFVPLCGLYFPKVAHKN